MNESSGSKRRPIRSYVLRKGRTTVAQERALKELWPRFGIPHSSGLVDPDQLFGRHAPLIIEIGFGDGQATWHMAQHEPDLNFMGIEVHPPGVGQLLLALDERQISNVRVARTDAVEFLTERIQAGSLDGVRIYFPDPWPKKRHHKRRLIQPALVDLLATRLKSGAVLHLATDWVPYAEHMQEVLEACAHFENLSAGSGHCSRPNWRPVTKYERRGQGLGHETRDLLFRRC